MFSKTLLFNMALAHIGDTYMIADAETENSKQARVCRMFYDMARQSVLSDMDWSFARKVKSLSILEGETDPKYDFVYRLPVDCLKPRRMLQPDIPTGQIYSGDYAYTRLAEESLPEELRAVYEPGVDSKGEVRTILTNLEQAQLVYTADYDNINLNTTVFNEALAIRLAMSLAMPIAASPSLSQSLGQAYQMTLQAAASQDMNGRQEPQYPTPDTITSRIC